MVLTSDGQVRRLSHADTSTPVTVIGELRVPKAFSAKDARSRRDLASALREASAGAAGAPRGKRVAEADDEILELRARIRQHPCHGCSDRETHARWAERYHRSERDLRDLEKRIEGRTNSIARRFDRICEVLAELVYLTSAGDRAEVTPPGHMLMRLYSESDLLCAQSLLDGDWSDLTAPELAAVCSAVVYESRRPEDDAPAPRPPTVGLSRALQRLATRWEGLHDTEHRHGLHTLRKPDPALVDAVYRWAEGASLVQVMLYGEVTAGDFVRWMRQVIDLLGQIAQAVPDEHPLRATAHAAVDSINRGVVAYTSA
jgi:ATP-dependent RNA helicase HelY